MVSSLKHTSQKLVIQQELIDLSLTQLAPFLKICIGNNLYEFFIIWVSFGFTKLQRGGCFDSHLSHLSVLYLSKSLVQEEMVHHLLRVNFVA